MKIIKILPKHFLLFIISFLIVSIVVTPVVAQIKSNVRELPIQELNSKAKQLYSNKEYQSSVELWEQIIDRYSQEGDNVNQAIALSSLALTYQKLNSYQQAESSIDKSLELIEQEDKSYKEELILGQVLDIQGKIYTAKGDYNKAIEIWNKSNLIYRENKATDKLKQNTINRSQVFQELGLYPRSCKILLEDILPQFKVNDCSDLEEIPVSEFKNIVDKITLDNPNTHTAIALRNLGNVLKAFSELDRSIITLKASLNITQKLNIPSEKSLTYLSLGNTDFVLAKIAKARGERKLYREEALNNYSKAIDLSPNSNIKTKAQLNKLSSLIELKQWSEVGTLSKIIKQENYQRSIDSNNIHDRINLAHNLIEILDNNQLQITNPQEIEEILINARKQAQLLEYKRGEAYANGNLGKLYQKINKLELANQTTQQALNLISSFESPDIAYQYYWQLGQIYKTQQNIPQAITAYTKAYDALQSLRQDLVTINPETQFSFRETVETIYRELVELDLQYTNYLKTIGNETERQEKLELARTVIESLQLAQINNFFREVCIDEQPTVIDKIDPQAAVIYPIILPDRLEILLSIPQKELQQYTIPVSQTEIQNTVQQIKNSLLSPNSKKEQFLPQYKKLYDDLIRPLESELRSVKTIAFVLDGELKNIPMSVLYDGEQYLIEKYPIALTPSLQILDSQPLTQVKLKTITAGLSQIRTNFKPHQGFDNLPNIATELKQIKPFTSQSLLNSEFTEQTLKQKITSSPTPIVHLATHGQFSSQLEDSFILTWDKRISIDRIDDLLRDDTLRRTQPIEMLILSACETASGDRRATLGLAGVTIRAGARSTVATLWKVFDESTAILMGELYNQLEQAQINNTNKAEALRQAQLKLIKGNKYNHPHFWSPFILIGNWR